MGTYRLKKVSEQRGIGHRNGEQRGFVAVLTRSTTAVRNDFAAELVRTRQRSVGRNCNGPNRRRCARNLGDIRGRLAAIRPCHAGQLRLASLTEVFPDAKTLLALEPEELGDVILELIHKGIGQNPGRFGASDILYAVNNRDTPQWPLSLRDQVTKAVGEAVGWLEHAGLVMFDPTQPQSIYWRTLTRTGERMRTRELAAAYREAAILPPGLVHPEILRESESAFLRGDHDIAVFAAFKRVEVAVRTAGGYGAVELGVQLMRKAFHPDTGPLTDKSAVPAEREAMGSLFVGAIGAAKNPTSHRDIEVSNIQAGRLIFFASYLMSIVDARQDGGSNKSVA